MRCNQLFFLVMTIIVISCSDEENISSNRIEFDKEIPLSDILVIKNIRLLNNLDSISLKPAHKIKFWGDYILYEPLELYKHNAKLIILDQDWNYLSEIVPTNGRPLNFRELTDFFILSDKLYIYDFQSQKFIVYKTGFEEITELRTPYYYKNFESLNNHLIAYSGKLTQLVKGEELNYNLISLDIESLEPKEYFLPFSQHKFNGTVIDPVYPLVNTGDEILFMNWWQDTVYSYQRDTLSSKYIFTYPEKGLPFDIKNKSHADLLVELRNDTYRSYQKGAAPSMSNEEIMVFSYGNKDKLSYGIYAYGSGRGATFNDYNYTLNERLLSGVRLDSDRFISSMYPYELLDYVHSGIVNSESLDSELLSQIENSEPDGSIVIIEFSLNFF